MSIVSNFGGLMPSSGLIDRTKLEARATTLANVRVVGPAWGEDLNRWLSGARAVVVPSIWHENFPYVILQAFAAGKPVIGSNRGGIPELVEAGPHGWLYEAMDPQALSARLREVTALPDATISEMGHAAQAYVRTEFTDQTIYQRLMEIYSDLLAPQEASI